MPAVECCLTCEKRQVGCHATCEEYLAALAEYKRQKAKIDKAKRQYKDARAPTQHERRRKSDS